MVLSDADIMHKLNRCGKRGFSPRHSFAVFLQNELTIGDSGGRVLAQAQRKPA
jgi:hypothetical protein